MKIITPLRIQVVSSLLMIEQKAGIVQIAFRDAVNHPSQPLRQGPDRVLDFCQKVTRAEIENAVHGIQTERVEVIILKPVQCVFDKESPHFVAARTVKVQSLTPRGTVTIGEVWSVNIKVVAFRP